MKNESIATSYCINIPEGATNGDVIKAMFPNAYDISNGKGGVSVYNFGGTEIPYGFNEIWWNAPYKAESEDDE